MHGAGTHDRRGGLRRGAALAVTAALLAAAAACGSEGDGGDKGGDGPAARTGASKAAPSAPAADTKGALTGARLTAAAFGDGEKVGAYTASEFALDGPHSDAYTADREVCQPLVSLAGDVAPVKPAAEVNRQVDAAGGVTGTSVAVQLRAYGGDGARAVMASLEKAGRDCAGGFAEQRAITSAPYLSVQTLKAPAGVGDEARAYRFTIQDVKDKGTRLYEYLTVVRSGTTTLSFRAEVLGTKDIGGVPPEVVTAQWEKFRAAVADGAKGSG
ncbi:hypothetical protein ABT160_45080 [Streptomyces sp. NPDC001941]|uniref:hypothetical protein n=1 Tax=Streptomyces sp. NPDC001941 TaxID=3154659 RepID=UPI003317B25E